MKKLIKILCFSFLIGGLLLPVKVGAVTLGDSTRIVTPMFSNINFFINSMDLSTNGEAYVYSYLNVRNADKASITVYLEKYNDTNKSWSSVKSWSASDSSTTVWLEGTYWVVRGQYRMRAVGSVYVNGNLVESTTGTTGTYTY